MKIAAGLALAAALMAGNAGPAAAQAPASPRLTLWDLVPGQHARDLNRESFAEYACGTRGGPPAQRIAGWLDFAKCRAEPDSGLHEVQFRYDDEPEYIARAFRADSQIAATEGTKIFIIPVIISALFDDDGFLVGIRAAADPRVSVEDRMRAISLQNFLMARFDSAGWECVDTPMAEGETPIGTTYRNQRCNKTKDGMKLFVEAYFFRKRGQVGIDPRTQELVAGQFRSDVLFEMALDGPVPDRAARLAAYAATPLTLTPAEANRVRAMNCPGCDLAGLDFKRQDLAGANLAGANLAGANFHGATLARADLSGANLAGANLNRSTMTLVRLAGADLSDAMAFGAVMDGADLGGAKLTKAHMGTARLTRANLEAATMIAVDMEGARLADANLKNADLSGTWLIDCELSRVDMTDANLSQAVLTNAKLTDANLTRAKFLTADLFGADLRGANLAGTDFTGSRLTSALLTNTNRQDATFTNVFGLPR